MSAGSAGHPLDARIEALVVSPGHNYWFHSRDPADGVGPHPTSYPDHVDVVAGQGIRGDRFYGKVSQLASAVSFFAAEALEAVEDELGLTAGSLDPRLARRNIVVRGIDLNALRHKTFSLDSGDGLVEFEASGETSPCAWMDDRLAPGARNALRGRGGLRANPTTSGTLRVGRVMLVTDALQDPALAGARVRRRSRLP
ncbi:MOSC domain-containing protein [Angustibacter luteus]|uniref:MOSC domain-containing protein n=1 Tax=Angustibacter luteus TaxID=658456 RepID=A0ABW1JE15_9ACTN